MAVYTPVGHGALEQFLARFDTGTLEGFEGIRGGVANTNYYVDTGAGAYVLTLFESLSAAELPFFLDLMAHLSAHGVPCAAPVADRQGRMLGVLAGRPAALFRRLAGREVSRANDIQLRGVGEVLARLHRTGTSFTQQRGNDYGVAWQGTTAEALAPRLDAQEKSLLSDETEHAARALGASLPRGIVHADLFRDNVLFTNNTVSGVLDFYFSCRELLMFDVAIVLNDWCSNDEGALELPRARILVNGYRAVRQPQAREMAALSILMRVAAFRFWLSRLFDKHFPRVAAVAHIKDPAQFRRILIDRRRHEDQYAEALA